MMAGIIRPHLYSTRKDTEEEQEEEEEKNKQKKKQQNRQEATWQVKIKWKKTTVNL